MKTINLEICLNDANEMLCNTCKYMQKNRRFDENLKLFCSLFVSELIQLGQDPEIKDSDFKIKVLRCEECKSYDKK